MTENPHSSRLRSLLEQYGIPTPESTPRFKSLLQDVFVDHPREMNLLITGLEEGIPAQLYDKKGKIPFEVISVQMIDRLNTNWGMERSVSTWVVETWAGAIGYNIPTFHTPVEDYNQNKFPKENLSIPCLSSLKIKKSWMTVGIIFLGLICINFLFPAISPFVSFSLILLDPAS